MPLELVADGGSEFQGQLMNELERIFGIKPKKTAPYNSQGNGRVETVHAIVKDMLRAFVNEFARDWDLLIPYFEFAYNTQVNKTTGYSPYFHILVENHFVLLTWQTEPRSLRRLPKGIMPTWWSTK
jgi:hypothetical protein